MTSLERSSVLFEFLADLDLVGVVDGISSSFLLAEFTPGATESSILVSLLLSSSFTIWITGGGERLEELERFRLIDMDPLLRRRGIL